MKKKLTFIIFFLCINNLSFAQDITLLEIDGIKFGDNLTNYVDEALIKESKVYSYKKDKYSPSRLMSLSKDFEYVEISYDKNYTIVELTGIVALANINECNVKKKFYLAKYGQLLNKVEKKENREKHPADKTGNSLIFGQTYHFEKDDRIQITCIDWSKKIESELGYTDSLNIMILRKNFGVWKQKNIQY